MIDDQLGWFLDHAETISPKNMERLRALGGGIVIQHHMAYQGAWSPFRHTAFTVLWTASVVFHIGAWMHDVAAGRLMTSLAPSPTMVSLVQAATTLPIFLLALPAGALSDIVDRCK